MQEKRVALVTGANQGIGFLTAKDLIANGVTVLVGSRDHGRGEAAAAQLGADARAIQLDVTDHASIAAAAKQIGVGFGRLDVLVNNAAIQTQENRPVNLWRSTRKETGQARYRSTKYERSGKQTFLKLGYVPGDVAAATQIPCGANRECIERCRLADAGGRPEL